MVIHLWFVLDLLFILGWTLFYYLYSSFSHLICWYYRIKCLYFYRTNSSYWFRSILYFMYSRSSVRYIQNKLHHASRLSSINRVKKYAHLSNSMWTERKKKQRKNEVTIIGSRPETNRVYIYKFYSMFSG